MADELTLKVDGKRLTGWNTVSVTVGIEQMPNSFAISASEKSPVTSRDAAGLREGAACTVQIGSDTVITGYVDTIDSGFAPGTHSVNVTGRGKCQDLVDCSAEWKGCQVSGSNALEIATKLAQPYGITVTAPGEPGPTIPQFNINVTNTPADVLELVTRQAGLLYYEGSDGNLVLSEVGAEDMGSGFVEGQNVQAARFVRSTAMRYSDYVCSLLSMDTSGLFEDQPGLLFDRQKDPYVARNRKLVLVAEGVMGGLELAKKRALWEASRRAGRGRQVAVTVDSWRDGKGRLWTPNRLAAVQLPSLHLKGARYCISQVTFKDGDESGRVADVILSPREAFQAQPIQLQPLIPGLTASDVPRA